jgi:NAD(P)-dependent dehydrogenase (short-subunit alcohol dehydrogenase family)
MLLPISFAKEGAAGVVIVDILNEDALLQGKKNVEAYGTKAGVLTGLHTTSLSQDGTVNQQLQCLAIRADITVEADVEQAVAEAVSEFGRFDYAV